MLFDAILFGGGFMAGVIVAMASMFCHLGSVAIRNQRVADDLCDSIEKLSKSAGVEALVPAGKRWY